MKLAISLTIGVLTIFGGVSARSLVEQVQDLEGETPHNSEPHVVSKREGEQNADPVTGLTIQQKTIVQSSWANIKNASSAYAAVILFYYFEKYPKYQQQFATLKYVPLRDLPGNGNFQTICSEMMMALGNVIDHLNDPESLKAHFSAINNKIHKHKITKEFFQDLKREILHVFRLVFGAQLTTETAAAWYKTINLSFTSMIPELVL